MAFSDYGFVGPERINPDTLAADPQRTGPGGYENRARFNFATRWRNKKVRGLNYGINGNFMKSRSSTILLWDNTDDGLYRSYPGTLTINRGTNWYLDPFVNYTGPRGMRHKLRSRFYRQQFDNSNDQSMTNVASRTSR